MNATVILNMSLVQSHTFLIDALYIRQWIASGKSIDENDFFFFRSRFRNGRETVASGELITNVRPMRATKKEYK